jgi:tagatose 1,6-diphosphate aldolase
MQPLSIGKYRGLQQCTSPRGVFTCLALDHRQNLRKANPVFLDDAELSRFKLEAVAALAGQASAVLLDPEVSAAQAVATGVIPGRVGLVVALESTGYGGDPTARSSQIIPGWSVEKAKRMGASMLKLLVYYHPDSATAAETEAFTRAVGQECLSHDLGLMIEPLSYSPNAVRLSSAEKRQVVIETARRLTQIPGVDVLKAELPFDPADSDLDLLAAALDELNAASATPWILLSAASTFENYLQQVIAACQAGASGIAVGRAVWQEAVNMLNDERQEFFRSTGAARLARLYDLCQALARPVGDFYTAEAPFDWYKTY